MPEHGLTLAFASAALALFSLVAGAQTQNDWKPDRSSSDRVKASSAKAPVRKPWARDRASRRGGSGIDT